MNWFDLVFSFSDIGILFNLWMCWLLWALMFLPPKILTVDRLHMGGLGLALPGILFIVKGEPTSTLHHEQTHTLQMRRYSPAGVAMYLGWHYGTGFLWQKVTGRPFNFSVLWENNPLEIEANKKMYEGRTPLCVETQAVVSFLLFTILLSGGTLWIL